MSVFERECASLLWGKLAKRSCPEILDTSWLARQDCPMISHSKCRHPETKTGRSQCRQVSVWIDQARDLGLDVLEHEASEGIRQWTIRSPKGGSRLIITFGSKITIHRYVPFLPDCDEYLTHRMVRHWIEVIAL